MSKVPPSSRSSNSSPKSPLQRLRKRLTDNISHISTGNHPHDESKFQSLDDFDSSWDSEPPLTPLTLKGYKKSTKRQLLSHELAEDLRQHIPSVLQINHSWTLRYSIEQDGTSLNTLYERCKPQVGENMRKRKGYFIVVMDNHGSVFGAYVNDYLRPQDGKYYYGNGDCFLWKSEHYKIKRLVSNKDGDLIKDDDDNQPVMEDNIRLKVYPYTSINDFIIYSNHDFISIGSGGGKFGLWIDSSFLHGASDPVDTFGNEQLSEDEKFTILGLEIWKVG